MENAPDARPSDAVAPPELATAELATSEPGGEHAVPTRGAVVREFLFFQLRLIADGLKDLLLSPLTVVLLIISLLSPRRSRAMWARLHRIGRGFDAWIDLFPDDEREPDRTHAQTMGSMLTQTEDLLRALRRDGSADPEVQAQLASIVRAVKKIAPGIGADSQPQATQSEQTAAKAS